MHNISFSPLLRTEPRDKQENYHESSGVFPHSSVISVSPSSKSTPHYKPTSGRASDIKVDLSQFSVSAAIESIYRHTDNYKMKCDHFQDKQGKVGVQPHLDRGLGLQKGKGRQQA